MSFEDDEIGIETSQPREGIEIRTPAVTYRIATGSRNITIDGKLFTASPAERGTVGIALQDEQDDMELSLPVSHAFCQRYIAAPPSRVVVTVYRKQLTSGEDEVVWEGLVTSGRIDGHVMSFRSPSAMAEQFERKPMLRTDRKCQHLLFDANCKVVRASFTVSTTVASFDGNEVTVAAMGQPDNWAQFGALLHLPTEEMYPISSQIGNVLTLDEPVFGIADGHAVQVFAGCDHTIFLGCEGKFENKQNYGGSPHMPRGNVFNVWGLGIYGTES